MSNERVWHRVPLTKLVFPSECSVCGAETDQIQNFTCGRTIMTQLVERIIGLGTYLTVPIPLCDECARSRRRRRVKGVVFGTVAGLAVAFGALVVLIGVLPTGHHASVVTPGLLVVVGPILGYIFGRSTQPVGLRNYSKRDGAVDISFTNHDFGERALRAMR